MTLLKCGGPKLHNSGRYFIGQQATVKLDLNQSLITEFRGESPRVYSWDEADSRRNVDCVGVRRLWCRVRGKDTHPSRGEMKPAISVGGRTGTAHNPTAYEWGTSRRGLPDLWSGTPRL
jgi:hypothetical protein